MLKLTLFLVILAAIIIFPLRYAITQGGFFHDGIMEGIQSCKADSDCGWVETTCCPCDQGGSEIVINKEKIWIFNLLIKPFCQSEQICQGENVCHNEQIYCNRSCKFGKPTYTPSLLIR